MIFFFPASVSDTLEPRWRRVGVVLAPCRRSEKKKKGHRRTPESGTSSLFRCPTRVERGHDAKNGVSVQPRLGHKSKLPIGCRILSHGYISNCKASILLVSYFLWLGLSPILVSLERLHKFSTSSTMDCVRTP